MQYGLTTGAPPVEHCFMCPDNWQLAFEPLTMPGSKGFVIPGSFPLTLEGATSPVLVPIPFSALIIGTSHNEKLQNPYGLNFDGDWMVTVGELLPLISGFKPGDPWSLHFQTGFDAGERKPKSLETSHPFMWVVYGRGSFEEALWSGTLGLASLIMNSRTERGSLPDLLGLWELWSALKVKSLTAYHAALMGRAADLNLLRTEQ